MPERDFSAWKVGDKTWMSERKKGWKSIRRRLEKNLAIRKKDQLTLLKSYFLTGQPPEEWTDELLNDPEYHKDCPLSALPELTNALVMECWLSADVSETVWQAIAKKYQEIEDFSFLWDKSRFFLRFQVLRGYPEEGTLFDGLEKRLYNFFGPTRFRRDDYPELPEKSFIEKAASNFDKIFPWLIKFLENDESNPNHIVQYMVREWGDTIVPKAILLKHLMETDPRYRRTVFTIGRSSKWSRYRLCRKEESLPEQVAVAQEVEAILEEVRPQLPSDIVELIDSGYAEGEELAREQGA